MKRRLGLILVLALGAGCRSSQPVYDPFLGPTVVPPPGTAAPPPGQPYYAAPAGAPATTAPPMGAPPPGASTAPMLPRGGVPLNFAPAPAGGMSSSFTPNVSPLQMQPGASPSLQPAPTAMQPGYIGPTASVPASAVRPVYGPPGGTAAYPYPQAGMAPQYGTPTLAQPPSGAAQPAVAQPASGGSVTPATHWGPAGQSSATGSQTLPTAAQSPGINGASSPPASSFSQTSTPIRIVTPSASPTSPNPSSPTLNQSWNSAPAALGNSPPGNATAANARIPEISELPPATGYTPASFNSKLPQSPISPATATPFPSSTAANNAAAAAPAGQSPVQLTNYGYDSQYRWLKGKLEYSQSTRTWRLRYIPPDGATDNYGGSVVLGDASKLNGLRPGDLVLAQGAPGSASGDQGSFAPLYNLAQIQKQ